MAYGQIVAIQQFYVTVEILSTFYLTYTLARTDLLLKKKQKNEQENREKKSIYCKWLTQYWNHWAVHLKWLNDKQYVIIDLSPNFFDHGQKKVVCVVRYNRIWNWFVIVIAIEHLIAKLSILPFKRMRTKGETLLSCVRKSRQKKIHLMMVAKAAARATKTAFVICQFGEKGIERTIFISFIHSFIHPCDANTKQTHKISIQLLFIYIYVLCTNQTVGSFLLLYAVRTKHTDKYVSKH